MAIIDEGRITIQPLDKAWYRQKAAALDMLRLDLVHPVVSGNKWYKLKHNLRYALDHGYRSVLSFGGAYSNHLAAVAVAAEESGLGSTGIIRGVHAEQSLTPTLAACMASGMQLVFVSREDYTRKNDTPFLEELAARFNHPFIIPEGGANVQGREGAAEIALRIPGHYTHICTAAGTGTTLIGLRNALPVEKTLLGFAPMKGGSYLKETLVQYIHPLQNRNWQLFDDWHLGGFGKWDRALTDFMNTFYHQHGIPLDIVYTAKMMYGIGVLLEQGYFTGDARILCIHSGGLQGNVSAADLLDYGRAGA